MKTSELINYVDRAMENDRDAIEAIYNYTYAGMYSLTYSLCRNKDAAEDILQESYIAAFAGLHTLRYKGEFWKWLKGIVINKWRDYSKSNVIFSDALEYDSAEEQFELEHPQMSIHEKLENEQKNSELWRLVNELPENQRVCIILFYYEDMSVDEIAQALQIPAGSVKSRLHYGRGRLKRMLQESDWFAGAEGGNAEASEKVTTQGS
ncbi:MAG: RNA polymerase sigma factor [Acutalibacteraceae bacterium]